MKFVMATHNKNKVRELSRILEPIGIEVTAAGALTEVDETGTTFEENAYLKAASACKETGMPAVADDSGICVHVLNGQPGVHSARWAGPDATDADRNQKLLEALRDVPDKDRLATFVSAICCVFPNGDILTARGECRGVIAHEERGEDGFGYDPLFLVGDKTYSEMTPEEKDAVSHRGEALRHFAAVLKSYKEKNK